jgi:transcriptional/translational regulatory protein YebC/TACO1
MGGVAEKLAASGVNVLSQDIDMIPDVEVDPADHIDSVRKLINRLEENDDVQNVYHNAILPEEEEEE